MTDSRTSIPKSCISGGLKCRFAESVRTAASIAVILLSLLISITLSDEIAEAVKAGLGLAANVIIPSVFPFIILSDLLYSMQARQASRLAERGFRYLFGIVGCGLFPFLLGALCGFPMGVRATAELYRDGRIDKDEAERLIGFTNNTGPAFLVCGVGLGMRGSIRDGIILYLAMLISAVAVGILFARHGQTEKEFYYPRVDVASARFSLVESVKGAGHASLNICSFIVFFSAVNGILYKLMGGGILYLFILPFLEIGGATSALAETQSISNGLSLILSGFATGFSGLSVHMQAKSFLAGTDITMKKYYPMKLLQGAIAACICAIFAFSGTQLCASM